MILTLKGADFSANNIGKIELPRDMNQETKNLLSVYTRFSIDDEIAYAIDDFVVSLINAGVWNRLSALYMPWLSSNIDQAATNYVTRAKGTVTNVELIDGELHSLVASGSKIILPETIATVNFHGIIRQDGTKYGVPRLSNGYGICLGTVTSVNNPVISKGPNANPSAGYVRGSLDTNTKVTIYEIGGLSDFETNSKTNGVSVVVGTNYTKSGEPFSDLIKEITPSTKIEDFTRSILFSGDGGTLTDSQRSVLISACNTLQQKLETNEG